MFRDRYHAGEVLSELILPLIDNNSIIFAIPNGGVPIAIPIINKLRKTHFRFEFQLLPVKKICIPNTNAGFGAITIQKEILLNGPLVTRMGMHPSEIQRLVRKTLQEIKRREAEYEIIKLNYRVKGRQIIIIDEGLPSGITMMAAIKSLQKFFPSKLIIAIPTASKIAINHIQPHVSKIICPNIRNSFFFSTSQAYEHYPQLNNEIVKSLLKEIKVAL